MARPIGTDGRFPSHVNIFSGSAAILHHAHYVLSGQQLVAGEIHFLLFHVTITTTLIATPRQLCGIHFVCLERGCSGMIFFVLGGCCGYTVWNTKYFWYEMVVSGGGCWGLVNDFLIFVFFLFWCQNGYKIIWNVLVVLLRGRKCSYLYTNLFKTAEHLCWIFVSFILLFFF